MSSGTASPPATPSSPAQATATTPLPPKAADPPAAKKVAESPAPPARPERIYWNSAGVPCPARVISERSDGYADLHVLMPDGQTTAIHSAPHAEGAGSWSLLGEDPGREGPNGDVVRVEGRPIAVGSLVTFWDTRGAEKLAVIRSVSLTSFDRRRLIKADLQNVDGLDSGALEAVVAAALHVPQGYDPGRLKSGVDWSAVEFGYKPGRWSWAA